MSDYYLPQISYWVAYQLLPHYAFNAFEKAHETWTKTPASAGPYYYLMACRMGECEPFREDAVQHVAASGTLGADFDYYLMQFPVPPPVDMSDTDPVALREAGIRVVLAPHFSAIVRHRDTGAVRYFILGQAPIGGGTTFRTVTAEGANANLGPGPLPERQAFLDRVAQHIA